MTDRLSRYHLGFRIVPVVIACRRGGLFAALESDPVTLDELCQQISANTTSMRVVIRQFQSLGWLNQSVTGKIVPTATLKQQKLIPDNMRDLLALDVFDCLRRGDFEVLERHFKLSSNRWNIDDDLVADFCDGLLLGPVLSFLANRFDLDDLTRVDFGVLPDSIRALVVNRFVSQGWLLNNANQLGLSADGILALHTATNPTDLDSLRSMLLQSYEVLFDTHRANKEAMSKGLSDVACESQPIVTSALTNDCVFADFESILMEIFDSTPLQDQPRYIADIGCGDGEFLKVTLESIHEKTSRGRSLAEFPLTPIGIDSSEAKISAAGAALSNEDSLFICSDTLDAPSVAANLEKNGVVPSKVLYLHSGLIANRPYIAPILESFADVDVQNTGKGNKVVGVDAVDSEYAATKSLGDADLVTAWATQVSDHGLVSLGMYSPNTTACAGVSDEQQNAFQSALEGPQEQRFIDADGSLIAAAALGLFPSRDHFRKYSGVHPRCRITLNRFEKRPYEVRMAQADDLQELLRLEDLCWEKDLRPSGQELLRRMRDYPEGQWALTMDGNVVGAVYSQRVDSVDVLRQARMEVIGELFNPAGPVVQLLSINVDPSQQQLGLGDQLLDWMLLRSALQGGVTTVSGLTRCKDFEGGSISELNAYIESRDTKGRPLDPILRFHFNHGASFLGAVEGFRPKDTDNLGTGTLLFYDFSAQKHNLHSPHEKRQILPLEVNADLSTKLEECLREVLSPAKQRAFSWDNSFRDMGVDSLGLLEFRTLLTQVFGRPISPTFFFSHPTLRSVQAFLGGDDSSSSSKISVDNDFVGLGDNLGERKSSSHIVDSDSRDIAIIGMAGQMPGATDIAEFWDLLIDGKDAITEVPVSRWDVNEFYSDDPDDPGKTISRFGGFLSDIADFDASFFGISPTEAKLMDPQQRLLLQAHWEALEDSGIDGNSLRDTQCGVFVGLYSHDYELLQIASIDETELGPYDATGNSASIAAGRIAYFLGTRGPAMTIDTACSSSLVAVHQAMESLRAGKCTMAIASGANLILSPRLSIIFSKAGMLSPDGRCKTFDDTANGYVRSEGCAAIVLKTLAEAKRDGNRILAILRGSNVNQDGASNGLTAPNLAAQEDLIRGALIDANLAPSEIDFIEAHGTGTNLGDPVEFAALQTVFGNDRKRQSALSLGSVKSNIGHAEAAAGIAGLIKAVLAMQHNKLPASLHFNNANKLIDLQSIPASINQQTHVWENVQRPLRAGVSSFGFSGTNAHVVVEQSLATQVQQSSVRTSYVLALSAKSEAALHALVRKYIDWLPTRSESELPDICFTANTGRAHHKFRLAGIGNSREEVVASLRGQLAGEETSGSSNTEPRIAFLFTGQGSQYVNMARELASTEPEFRRALKQCCEILDADMGKSLEKILFPSTATTDDQTRRLNDTAITQPALFAVEYSLARMLQSWGIEPYAVMGHSVGEYVAACIAGVFSLQDGLELIATRGRLMGSLPKGGIMVAALGSRAAVLQTLTGFQDVAIAAYNGPENVVLSGPESAVQSVCKVLETAGLKIFPLHVSHAFHSHMMDPILPDFRDATRKVSVNKPVVKMVSNVTGSYATEELLDAEYWVSHIREPVRFEESIRCLLNDGIDIMLEIGPHPVLGPLGQAIEADSSTGDFGQHVSWPTTLSRDTSDWACVSSVLKSLYENNVSIDWAKFEFESTRNIVSVPLYPWQKKKFWFADTTAYSRMSRPMDRRSVPSNSRLLYQPEWKVKAVDSGIEQAAAFDNAVHWIVLANQSELGIRLAEKIREVGCNCDTIYMGSAVEKSAHAHLINNIEELQARLVSIAKSSSSVEFQILNLWPMEGASSDLSKMSFLRDASKIGLQLVETIRVAAEVKATAFYVVTENGRAVEEKEDLTLSAATCSGISNVAWAEYPDLAVKQLDLDKSAAIDAKVAALTSEMRGAIDDIRVAYRRGQRMVPSLSPIAMRCKSFECRSDGTYLIVGGMGELGLHSAEWLIRRGARHIVLAGRTLLPGEDSWRDFDDDPVLAAKIRVLKNINASNARIEFEKLDINDAKQTEQLVERLAEIGSLRGVVHCAAAVSDQLIADVTPDAFDTVLRPKVAGTANLVETLDGHCLDFLLLYSSIGSIVGLPGQVSYAAANSFLDGLAYKLRNRGVPALSINWCGWRGTGLARTPGGKRALDELDLIGIGSLAAHEAIDQLDAALASGLSQVVVVPRSKNSSFSDSSGGLDPQIASLFSTTISSDSDTAASSNVQNTIVAQRPFANVRGEELIEQLNELVTNTIAELLDISVSDVSLESSLGDMGMDSLLGFEFRKLMQARTGIMLSATFAWNFPTVTSIVTHVHQRISKQSNAKNTSDESLTKQPSTAKSEGTLPADVNDISEEEALRRLMGEV